MKFFRAFIFTALFIILSKYAAIIFVDPYRVFGISDFNQINFPPNTYLLKKEHLEKNDYEAYVFGTSRANSYRSSILRKHSGLNYYNLSGLNFKLANIERFLEWIIKNKDITKIKEIILTLDYDLMFLGHLEPSYYLQIQPPPDVYPISKFDFYTQNLSVSFSTLAEAFKGNFKEKVEFAFDVTSGEYNLPKDTKEKVFHRDVPYPKFVGISPDKLNAKKIDTSLVSNFNSKCVLDKLGDTKVNEGSFVVFDRILKLIDKIGARPVFLIGPLLVENEFALDSYINWLREIKKRVPKFWHFGLFHQYTRSYIHYYDTSHFNYFLADKVMAKMYGKELKDDDDFGVQVSDSNFQSVIHTLVAKKEIYNNKSPCLP